MQKVIVLSLGGSIIIQEKINYNFLHKLKKTLQKNSKDYKFVIVCGGGKIARYYMDLLKKEGKSVKTQSLAGMNMTQMNARFLINFLGEQTNKELPRSMKDIENNLNKNKIVVLGSMHFHYKETSDSTAARVAASLKSNLVNMTNVSGLYDKNPIKNKSAKLIHYISWKDFEKKAKEIRYKPGQHFVLDQRASSIIKKNKTKTYIIGENLVNFENLIKNKKFIGTIIEG